MMYPAPTRRIQNPFINVLAGGIARAGWRVQSIARSFFATPQVLHVHWLEQVYWGRLARWFPRLADWRARHLVAVAGAVRWKGGRVVWTLHNLRPHEPLDDMRQAAWDRLAAQFLPLVTDVVVMSQHALAEIDAAYPRLREARRHVIAHPHFRDFYGAQGVDFTQTSHLNLVPTIAMVGMLRPYKGVLEVVGKLKAHPQANFQMIIAGTGPQAYCDRIRQAIGNDDRFVFIQQRISHAQFADIVMCADVALFNFRSILNSGSVMAALSLGTPVICPADGALRELAEAVGPDWMTTFDSRIDAAWILERLERLPRLDRLHPPLAAFSPTRIGAAYARIYAGLQ